MISRSRRPATDDQKKVLKLLNLKPATSDAQCGMMIRYVRHGAGPYDPHRIRQIKRLLGAEVKVCHKRSHIFGQSGHVRGIRLRTKAEIKAAHSRFLGELVLLVTIGSCTYHVAPSHLKVITV